GRTGSGCVCTTASSPHCGETTNAPEHLPSTRSFGQVLPKSSVWTPGSSWSPCTPESCGRTRRRSWTYLRPLNPQDPRTVSSLVTICRGTSPTSQVGKGRCVG